MDLEQLAKDVQMLKDIEEIKKLQGKYYRCLDTKDWDALGECFAPDMHTAFSDGRLVFDNWTDLRAFYEGNMSAKQQISQHNGHTPEITVTSEETASAKWYLNDYLIVLDHNVGVRGTAIYDIDYKKYDGKWLIKNIGYKRIFEENWSRADYSKRRITESMFNKKKGHGGAVYADGRKK